MLNSSKNIIFLYMMYTQTQNPNRQKNVQI